MILYRNCTHQLVQSLFGVCVSESLLPDSPVVHLELLLGGLNSSIQWVALWSDVTLTIKLPLRALFVSFKTIDFLTKLLLLHIDKNRLLRGTLLFLL